MLFIINPLADQNEQIDIVQPKVICRIGGPSASAVIRPEFKITRERGVFVGTRFGAEVIAALHPAYILRQSGEAHDQSLQLLVTDITSAKLRAKDLR